MSDSFSASSLKVGWPPRMEFFLAVFPKVNLLPPSSRVPALCCLKSIKNSVVMHAVSFLTSDALPSQRLVDKSAATLRFSWENHASVAAPARAARQLGVQCCFLSCRMLLFAARAMFYQSGFKDILRHQFFNAVSTLSSLSLPAECPIIQMSLALPSSRLTCCSVCVGAA